MLEDGIYIIKDRLGDAGDSKTLVTGAFNNRDTVLTNLNTNFAYINSDLWADWGNYNFVQDDDAFYVTTHDIIKRFNFNIQNCVTGIIGYGCPLHRSTGCWTNPEYDNTWCIYYEIDEDVQPYCEYYDAKIATLEFWQEAISAGSNYSIIWGNRYDHYTFPTPTTSGDIISVAVWAEVRGKTALSLNSSTFEIKTSETHQFEWESLVYTEKPVGGTWAWSDLASGALKAGVKCYYIEDKIDSGVCRRLKVVITTTTGEITLWPSGDYVTDYTYSLQPVAGNYLDDLDKGQELCDILCTDRDWPPALMKTGTASVTNPCITSDLSEIAPRFSVIDSIKVSVKYSCNDVTGSTGYIRPFIEINGTKYYGTSSSLDNAGDYVELDIDYTWSTNPATSAVWDYDDYKALKFGVHANLDSSPANGVFIFQLYATTAYHERHMEPEFTRLDAKLISFREESQTPKLIAPDLRFISPFPLAERLRIMLVHGESPRFVGFVWACRYASGNYEILAKGYQEILKFRYIPKLSYSPKLDSLSVRLTLDDILSSNPPTNPLHSHVGETRTQDDSLTSTPDWVSALADRIMITHESFYGLIWAWNSYIPTGNGESSGKIPEMGGMATGRPIFGIDRQISQIDWPYSIFDGDWEWMYTYQSYYDTTEWPIYGPGNACQGSYGDAYYSDGFQIDGIRRLAKHNSATCSEEQYYPSSDNGLYVNSWPDHQLIFIDYAMDTYVDLDETDQGDKYLNEPLDLNGSADGVLSNIFELAAQEVTATPGWDGRLHLIAKTSNGRGSEASPIFNFINGVNCDVETSTATDPPIDVAIGYDTGCQSAMDLQQSDARFVKPLQTNRAGQDLDVYLSSVLDANTQEFLITSPSLDQSNLRPLDWITVDGIAERIRSIEIQPDKIIIVAGKKPINLNEKFGEWLHKPIDSDMSQVISSYEFTDSDFPITQVFWVKASDYMRSDWAVRLALSWTLTVPDEDTIATLTETPKAWVTIDDVVIAPGKVLLNGKSGSVTFDISSASGKSTTADVDNTVKVYLEDHLSETASPTFYHTVTGKIEQFRVAAVLENA